MSMGMSNKELQVAIDQASSERRMWGENNEVDNHIANLMAIQLLRASEPTHPINAVQKAIDQVSDQLHKAEMGALTSATCNQFRSRLEKLYALQDMLLEASVDTPSKKEQE